MTDSTPTADQVVSPKVVAPAIATGVYIVVLVTLGAITPDLLAPIGPWSVVVFAFVQGVIQAIAGYAKKDPRRE